MAAVFPRVVGLMVLAAVIAGCVQPAALDPVPAQAPAIDIVDDRPDTSFGEVITGPAAEPDLGATTAAAPKLVPGEWWRIQFSSDFFAQTSEVVRVVADVEQDAAGAPEGYLFGMPHEGWFKEAIAYHAPAFGDVGLDLSYETHNERFEPVRFPLVKGATWTTTFGTSPFIATVDEADEFTATIRYDAPPSDPEPTDPVMAALDPFGGMSGMRALYDARQHEVVRFESPIGSWEVTEHGYDFEGWVTVPRGIHTAIDHGQFLALTPGAPPITQSVEVDGGFNRLTLLQVIVPLGPGAYRVRAVTPDGTEFVTESIAGREFTMNFYEASDPDGTWTLENVVGGPGATYMMGMAYHQYDIRLPEGARRSDHSHEVMR